MKTNWPAYRLAGLLLASIVFLASSASAQTGSLPAPAAASFSAATLITQVDVSRAGEQTNVRVEGNGHLSYQASWLNSPDRLVLDFSGVKVTASKTIPSEVQPVRGVRVGQFKSDVARVVIELERMVPYIVTAEGQSVTVVFVAPAPRPMPLETPAAPPRRLEATIAEKSPVQPQASDPSAMPPPERLTQRTAAPPRKPVGTIALKWPVQPAASDPSAVPLTEPSTQRTAALASPASPQPGSPAAPAATSMSAATLITQVEVNRADQQTNVRVEGNGHLSYQASRLNSPERLVLDFSGVNVAASKTIPSEVEPVRGVRVGQFNRDVARVVIELERVVPYTVKAEGQSVTVAFAAPAPRPTPSETPAAPPSKLEATIAEKSPVQPPASDPPAVPLTERSTQRIAAVASPAPPAPKQGPAQNDALQSPALAPTLQTRNSGQPTSMKLKDMPLNAQDPAQGSELDLSASASRTPAVAPPSAIVSNQYLINPEDVLDVYVYDVPELTREYTVSGAGTITVPLLPQPVQAAGMSPDEFARALEESFRQSGRLSHPEISVAIKLSRRSVVAVDGAVKSPQALLVIGRTRLLSVLYQCGGLADDAGSTVTVARGALARRDLAREGGPATPTLTVELKKLMDGNDPTSKLDVWPGDRVSVERAGIFYVLGEVNRPGGYNLRSAQEQVTVLEALAIVGDFTSIAKRNKTVIIRKDSTAPSGRREIALNVADILAGRSPDQVLQTNDILYVPASGGKRAMRTLTTVPTSVVGAAATSVVYRR